MQQLHEKFTSLLHRVVQIRKDKILHVNIVFLNVTT